MECQSIDGKFIQLYEKEVSVEIFFTDDYIGILFLCGTLAYSDIPAHQPSTHKGDLNRTSVFTHLKLKN